MNLSQYGYEIPSTGDFSKGTNGWMAQLAFNWARIDQHTHNGVDSALLNIGSFATVSVVAPAASWVANTGGSGLPSSGYVQLVTTPAIVGEINNYIVKFLVNTSGSRQYEPLQVFYARVTGTTFNLYCNDNTIDILCVFR